MYVHAHGKAEKVWGVVGKLRFARKHYEKVALGTGFVIYFIQ